MKSLTEYLREELFATPLNTIGMGGIAAPEGDTPGSGDIPTGPVTIPVKKKRKKFRRYKVV